MTAGEAKPHELAVPLGDFSAAALSAAAGGGCTLEAVARQSIYYYLSNGDSGRPGWPYPRFLRDGAPPESSEVVLSLRVDGAAWERFVAEAEAQRVSPERLLRHAVLFFAADVESGRVARRLLDELREPGGAGA
jgi:hypothetical protein